MYFIYRFAGLLVVILILSAGQTPAGEVERYRYQQRTGAQTEYFDWRLSKGAELQLHTRQQQETTTTVFNPDLSTLSWSINSPNTQTALTVIRTGDTLVMNGVFEGDDINKKVSIDPAPWYQALSVSLRQFVDPQQESVHFWTIRPDTLDVHRLQVSKQKTTSIDIDDYSVAAIQLKIQPTGWRAPFWSANYWLGKDDGVFIRYQGRSGPPGTPLTSVVLVGPLVADSSF